MKGQGYTGLSMTRPCPCPPNHLLETKRKELREQSARLRNGVQGKSRGQWRPQNRRRTKEATGEMMVIYTHYLEVVLFFSVINRVLFIESSQTHRKERRCTTSTTRKTVVFGLQVSSSCRSAGLYIAHLSKGPGISAPPVPLPLPFGLAAGDDAQLFSGR